MLEKTAGITLIDKLQAILLMEADYNFSNNFIFGNLSEKTAGGGVRVRGTV
jgi:hypothetical protein